MKINGRLSLVDNGYIDNLGCPTGDTFPVPQEGEIFVLKDHSSLSDGLYLYLKGQWNPVGSSIKSIGSESQPEPMFYDISRSKELSVAKNTFLFNHVLVKLETWLGVGSNIGSKSGYVAPFNGTIIGAIAMTQDAGVGTTMNLDCYLNNVVTSTILSLVSVGTNQYVSSKSLNLNLDFNENDLIQIRSNRTIGSSDMEEVAVTLIVRWRA